MREALSNALRQSAAETISVAISASGDAVGIQVGDDGQGFDLAVEDWAWAPLSSMGTNRPRRGHLAHRHRTG